MGYLIRTRYFESEDCELLVTRSTWEPQPTASHQVCSWPAGDYGEDCGAPGNWRQLYELPPGERNAWASYLCNTHMCEYIRADDPYAGNELLSFEVTDD